MIEISVKKRLQGVEGTIDLKIGTTIETGAFVSIFGASGAGKTTLLRMISGLERPDEGRIVVDGEVWFDSARKIDLPPQKRRTGFVFQDYALFPNMSVRENLAYALEKGDDPKSIERLLERVGLSALADRYPSQLSGGQRQRVAMARALVRHPKLLLLDEPLSALDHDMRLKLQEELLKIHKMFGVTTLLVSHDPSEIFRLCHRVIVIENGIVAKTGTPSDVFVKDRIGSTLKFTGEILQISQSEMVTILTLSVGNQLVKVVASESEAADLKIGDRVQLVSKAFHPMISKIETS
ncbi:MAG: molybdenum ABC transporter ATP-binding protein [Campylobacteraceae bacterium 4484_4]|nr:MAG: molybdenum ABC transporter ATP-binding protein [Campylobacteraceae bacterium 4484_4]